MSFDERLEQADRVLTLRRMGLVALYVGILFLACYLVTWSYQLIDASSNLQVLLGVLISVLTTGAVLCLIPKGIRLLCK
jgi:hypothetical protein